MCNCLGLLITIYYVFQKSDLLTLVADHSCGMYYQKLTFAPNSLSINMYRNTVLSSSMYVQRFIIFPLVIIKGQ